MSDYQRVRHEGAMAFYRNQDFLDNPYRDGPFADAWEQGFIRAYEENQLEETGKCQ